MRRSGVRSPSAPPNQRLDSRCASPPRVISNVVPCRAWRGGVPSHTAAPLSDEIAGGVAPICPYDCDLSDERTVSERRTTAGVAAQFSERALHLSPQAPRSGTNRKVPSRLERLARGGYAARGIVYLIAGALTTAAATGSGGRTTGAKGALIELSWQPLGYVLVAALALGLCCFAAWRIYEAIADPEGKGGG
jgi:Domain of Unknown Function (DUF1206)